MSPEATAAAVAAVAHGLRQQMQMAAVAHHVDSPPNLFSLPHLQQKSPSQRSQPPVTTQPPSNLSSSRSQHTSPHDMRMQSPEDTPISSPIEMTLEPSVNLAVGVSGLPYGKPPEILFADDLSRNCTSSNTSSTSANSGNIKLEPIGDCRGD
ncbi:bab1 family protein [Megaselia abdita]